jgi:hypothetical protein
MTPGRHDRMTAARRASAEARSCQSRPVDPHDRRARITEHEGVGAEEIAAGRRAPHGAGAVELSVRDPLPLPKPQREQLGTRLYVAAVQDEHVARVGAQVDTGRPLA